MRVGMGAHSLQLSLSRAGYLSDSALTYASCYRIKERVVSIARFTNCTFGWAVLTTLKLLRF